MNIGFLSLCVLHRLYMDSIQQNVCEINGWAMRKKCAEKLVTTVFAAKIAKKQIARILPTFVGCKNPGRFMRPGQGSRSAEKQLRACYDQKSTSVS